MPKQAKKKSPKEKTGVPPKASNPQGTDLLKWTVTPFRQEKKKGIIFALSCLAFLALLYILYREIIWVVLAVAVLVGAYSSHIFPSHYRLTTEGVAIKSLFHGTFKTWSQYTNIRKHPDGVFLVHGIGKKSKLGQFIYFGDRTPAEVVAVVEKYIDRK